MKATTVYKIKLPYATRTVVVGWDGNVCDTTPESAWMLGASLTEISWWILKNGGTIDESTEAKEKS